MVLGKYIQKCSRVGFQTRPHLRLPDAPVLQAEVPWRRFLQQVVRERVKGIEIALRQQSVLVCSQDAL